MAKIGKNKSSAGPDLKAFFDYIQDVSSSKGLKREEVLDVVRGSLITAYQKKLGQEATLEVILDKDKPEVAVVWRRDVVAETEDPVLQVTVSDAQESQAGLKEGDVLEIKENPFDFSRIGASNVRQILLQRLKELEREIIYNEFKNREGELINGYFLRWRDRDVVYVDLGKAEGILPRKEQIPGEKFRSGDRVKAIIKTVELSREKVKEPGPFITISRASGDFVRKLFEMEIPEVYDGVVEILGIVRQAGFRTKILVRSNRMDVDPVGACVGIKGVRIQSIVRELGNERIDIVSYSEHPDELIANALSPAKVLEVRFDTRDNEAFVLVPDDAYSLAIGNNGQNVRLASQLTQFKLSVKSMSQYNEEMASPEARARLEQLFRGPEKSAAIGENAGQGAGFGLATEQGDEEEEEDYTPLSDLPGITERVISLLEDNSIKSVERLLELQPDELERVPGIGKNTAKQILKILSESVEYEEV